MTKPIVPIDDEPETLSDSQVLELLDAIKEQYPKAADKWLSRHRKTEIVTVPENPKPWRPDPSPSYPFPWPEPKILFSPNTSLEGGQ